MYGRGDGNDKSPGATRGITRLWYPSLSTLPDYRMRIMTVSESSCAAIPTTAMAGLASATERCVLRIPDENILADPVLR